MRSGTECQSASVFCVADRENLCDSPEFTGYTCDGGYATHMVAKAGYVVELPPGNEIATAPLLCAGLIGYRDALYYSVTGDQFSGKEAAAMKCVNKSVPSDQLRKEVMQLAVKLQAKSPFAVRYTKEALRAVRGMTKDQAFHNLNAKSDALKGMDPEGGRQKAMKQFLDEKSYKPGLGDFAR